MKTYSRYSLTVSHGKGCLLYDDQGKEYIDCTAGIATCCLGHSHPRLKEAICNQMDRVHHVSNLYFIPEQAKLAKWLVENSCADKVSEHSSSISSNNFNNTPCLRYFFAILGRKQMRQLLSLPANTPIL